MQLEPAAVKYDVVTRQIGADVSQNQGEICKLTLDGSAPILALFCVSERIFSAHKLAFSLALPVDCAFCPIINLHFLPLSSSAWHLAVLIVTLMIVDSEASPRLH